MMTIDATDTPRHIAAATSDGLRRAAALALDWLMPRVCVLCDASEDGSEADGSPRPSDAGAILCADCRRDATASMADVCDRCALPLPQSMPQPMPRSMPSAGDARSAARICGRCLRRPPAFDRTCAAAAYAAPFEQLVRGLKYGATLAYAPLLADLIDERARIGLDELQAIDVLVPVPLSRDRMASRGFNQAIEIGRVLARRWDRPLDTGSVLRIVDTPPQAGLRLDARRRNVRDAFAVIDVRRSRLVGRRVAVIDDVMTTGATLDEVARTLKRVGVARVDNLVVARRR